MTWHYYGIQGLATGGLTSQAIALGPQLSFWNNNLIFYLQGRVIKTETKAQKDFSIYQSTPQIATMTRTGIAEPKSVEPHLCLQQLNGPSTWAMFSCFLRHIKLDWKLSS